MGAPGTEVRLERPREESHGDLATNLALQLAKPLRRKPRDLAQEIVDRLGLLNGLVDKVEIAGPGFINFTLGQTALTGDVVAITT